MVLDTAIKNTISILCYLILVAVQGQEVDLLIKNGHVFDPKNNLDTVLDISIGGGKILEVAPDIASENAKKVVDATGLYVCPGLIDIHTHVFVGAKADKFADGNNSLSPDDFRNHYSS